jgi:cytochrome P450
MHAGPNEVVCFTADAFPVIHGPGSKCIKAPWYDMVQKDRSIHATRQPKLHNDRRRIWDQGFGMKALQSYQTIINRQVEHLCQNVQRTGGTVVNFTQLALFFGFDVMGDTAFGDAFGMLETNKAHPVVDIMRSGIFVLGRLTPIPWLVTILTSIPGANKDFLKLERFAEQQVEIRMKLEREETDVSDCVSCNFERNKAC